MKKIIILSTNTHHHRYFINSIIKNCINIACCVFENKHVQPNFPIGPLYENKENLFESSRFFIDIDKNLPTKLIHEVDTVNSKMAIELIAKIKPDFGIVFGTGKIKKHVINLFPDGLLNVHRGVAQKYRGLDSDLWAIYHSDYSNIGVTIHSVDTTLDTGDIVYQQRMPIKKNMKIHHIRYYTTLIVTELMLKAIFDYLNNKVVNKPQDRLGRYYSFMPLDLKKIVQKKFNHYCKNKFETNA